MSVEHVLAEHSGRRGWGERTQLALLCRFIEGEGRAAELEQFLGSVSDADEATSFDVYAWTAHEDRRWRVDRAVPGRSVARRRALLVAEQYKNNFGSDDVQLVVADNGRAQLVTNTQPPCVLAQFWFEPAQ